MMGEKARRRIEQSYASMPLTTFLPGTRDLVIDADDNLWVQHFPRAGQANVTWTVFGNDGRVRATIALPATLEVYEIGRDYVLGRYIDADAAVPEVRLYRLMR